MSQPSEQMLLKSDADNGNVANISFEPETDNADHGDEAEAPSSGNEERARRMGWRPQDEYTGNREWVDADTFLRRGEEILPVMRDNLHKLEARLKEKEQAIDELHAFYKKAEERAKTRAIEEIKKQRTDAITRGDGEAFEQADQAMREMEAEAPAIKPKQAQQQPNPVYVQWANESPWYGKDAKLTAYAEAFSAENKGRFDPNNPKAFLDMVDGEIRKTFPQAFGSRRGMPPMVESVATSGMEMGSSRNRFAAIPAEDRKQYDRLVKNGAKGIDGKPLTKEEFAKYYFE